jgi:hypothetical protein
MKLALLAMVAYWIFEQASGSSSPAPACNCPAPASGNCPECDPMAGWNAGYERGYSDGFNQATASCGEGAAVDPCAFWGDC